MIFRRTMTTSLARSEHDIQQSILKYLKKRNLFCWRNNSGVTVIQHRFIRFGAKGAPDILGILPDGRFLGIEVKKPGGALRPEQATFLENINKSNGLAFVARSVDDVKAALLSYES